MPQHLTSVGLSWQQPPPKNIKGARYPLVLICRPHPAPLTSIEILHRNIGSTKNPSGKGTGVDANVSFLPRCCTKTVTSASGLTFETQTKDSQRLTNLVLEPPVKYKVRKGIFGYETCQADEATTPQGGRAPSLIAGMTKLCRVRDAPPRGDSCDTADGTGLPARLRSLPQFS